MSAQWSDMDDSLRELTSVEIASIINDMKISNMDSPIHDNIIHIHREKTRQKLIGKKVKASKIPMLKELILKHFYATLSEPGEAVGVSAAQAIGEPTTQMTLNSIAGVERIIIWNRTVGYYLIEIGVWIDKLIEDNRHLVQVIPKNNTLFLPMPGDNFIISPNEMGELDWTPITGVTKHLPQGHLIKFTTSSGKSVIATQTKSMLVYNSKNGMLEQVNGSDVTIADYIPVIDMRIENPQDAAEINNYYNAKSIVLQDFMETGKMTDAGIYIKSITLARLIIALSFIGIYSEIIDSTTIFICGHDAYKFTEEFNGYVWRLYKKQPIRTLGHTRLEKLLKIELMSDEPELKFVYDLTVPKTTNFSLSNGICVADTFHHTGISAKNVTLGFSRAKELFNATKDISTPTCTIYFKNNNDNLQKLHEISDTIPECKINDYVKDYTIGNVTDPSPTPFWEKCYCKLYNIDAKILDLPFIEFNFNLEKIYNIKLDFFKIVSTLDNSFTDIYTIPSPLFMGKVRVHVNVAGVENVTKYLESFVALKICSKIVSGVPNITKMYRRKVSSQVYVNNMKLKPEIAANIKTTEEWVIDTDGTNLIGVFGLEYVDPLRTISNDIWEIYNMLGIEAARTFLINEFTNIVNASGTSINLVHIHILVDKMTYTGSIRAISRTGVETSQYDPLTRATFEEMMTQLVTSAIFSETDNLNGISSNIVLGNKINAGTGFVQLSDPVNTIIKKVPMQNHHNAEIETF